MDRCMYSLVSLPKALAWNCSKLWERSQRPAKECLFLSHSLASAFSTAASLQRGVWGGRSVGARAVWLPLAPPGRQGFIVGQSWRVERLPVHHWGHRPTLSTCKCSLQLPSSGDVVWVKCCIMEKLKLFCVSVLGLGWKFLCNTDDNILSFPYPKR